MRRVARAAVLVLLAACAPAEDRAVEQEAAPSASISLADVAGTWTLHALSAEGDSTIAIAGLVATASTEGWTMTLPERDPIPTRVVLIDGDSVVIESGPYQSVLRERVEVTTRNVLRLDEGMLLGTFVAHYASGPDSVLRGRVEGSRTP